MTARNVEQALRPRRALDAALAHLDRVLADCRANGRARLPTLVVLSAGAGVSHMTMLQALRRLRQAGQLESRQGSGTFLAGAAMGSEPPAEPSGQRWQRVAQQLEGDALAARLGARGERMSLKVLAARCRVSYPTAAKALAVLEERGVLERVGRSVRVRWPGTASAGSSVVVVARRPARQMAPRERTRDDMHAFESECALSGLRVRMALCDFVAGKCRLLAGADKLLRPGASGDTLGYAVFAPGLEDDFLRATLAQLAGTARPVAVLDEGLLVQPPVAVPSPLVRVFTSAGTAQPGRLVARYLAGLGHRRVAYVTLNHDAHWSQVRYQGLVAGFESLAVHDAVRLFAGAVTLPAADPAVSARIDPRRRLDAEDLGIRRSVREMLGADGRYAVYQADLRARGTDRTARALEPLVGYALADRSCTAWVGANDDLALLCLAHLRQRAVRVPGGLSVVGFDNTHAAFAAGLTSYDFNSPAVGRAMLAHLTNPSWAPLRNRGKSVTIEGFVVARSTSGPARTV